MKDDDEAVEVMVLERCLRENMSERMLPELVEDMVLMESLSDLSSARSSFLRLDCEPWRLEKTLLTKDFLCLSWVWGLNSCLNWSSGTGRRSKGMVLVTVLILLACVGVKNWWRIKAEGY